MTTTVTKSFTFDAGHRLAKGYPEKCKYPHGHTYKVEFTASLQGQNLDEYDMSVDFGLFKVVKQWVDENFDHKMVLYEGDPFVQPYIEAMKVIGFNAEFGGLTLIDKNPTAEVFAEIIANKAVELLPDFVRIETVTIWETPTSYATFHFAI